MATAKVQINARLEPSTYRRLVTRAKQTGVTLTAVVELALTEHLTETKESK